MQKICPLFTNFCLNLIINTHDPLNLMLFGRYLNMYSGVNIQKIKWAFLCFLMLFIYQNCGSIDANTDDFGGATLGSNRVTFAMIQVIMNNNCVSCHQLPTSSNGNIALTTYNEITGNLVVPGSAYQSKLYQGVESGDRPANRSLLQTDIDRIQVWIDTGAIEDSF